MNPRKAVLIVFLFASVAGLGLSAYTVMSDVKISVTDENVKIYPTSSTMSFTAGGYVTKTFTVKTTSTDNVTVKLKVIPADSNTVKEWGDGFVAVVSPETVKVSLNHPASVVLVAHSEKSGSYKVKLIAVR